MSRKRTPDEKPADNSTAVAEPPAAANDNAPAANDNKPSFAERVGQRPRVSAADPYLIAVDVALGVRLFESKRDRQMALKFEEKPSQMVIDLLKEADYRWNPVDKIWRIPSGPNLP